MLDFGYTLHVTSRHFCVDALCDPLRGATYKGELACPRGLPSLNYISTGLAVDYKQRRLYYTNMDQIVAGGVSYSWHKIEMINLDGTQRRTIYNLAERPRGLSIDLNKGSVIGSFADSR